MPELPEVEVYLGALRSCILGKPLEGIRLGSPFLVRTVDPPLSSLVGRRVEDLRRLGKRIVIGFEEDLFAVLHLMIAGRLHWKPRGAKIQGKIGVAAFDFPAGTLTLTEAGSKKRASLHLVRGEDALAAYDPGGLEVLTADLDTFREALVSENHTLKRALTDPRLFSGIGDPVVLRRILDNLLRNALESLPPKGGSVAFDVRRGPRGVRILVADTGRGMSEQELARAFDDFHTTKAGGTGLGLSVVRRLTADLQGELQVESVPGRGTTFTIDLPSVTS